jgi:hypothetical protein
MSSPEVSKQESELDKKFVTTDPSLCNSDLEATSITEKATAHNQVDGPDSDEVEWIDRGYKHDIESQKSHVSPHFHPF